MFSNNTYIILSHPQLAMNIGLVARAIQNFNITNLRLVNPKQDIINNDEFKNIALKSSADAKEIFKNITVFNSLQNAIADLHCSFSITSRKRYLHKDFISLHDLLNNTYFKSINNQNNKIGFVFGCEKSGLSNQEISCTNACIYIPSNINFPSLNLSHAVLAVSYELSKIKEFSLQHQVINNDTKHDFATNSDTQIFLEYFFQTLTDKNFFPEINKKELMMQNLSSIFFKSKLTKKDIKTLTGVVKILSNNK
jgi:tRNA/rRNA methyltransferase